MRLLIDEMWEPEIAAQLRRRGHEAVAVQERSELRGEGDPAIFAAAQAEQRAIVTEDRRDFRPLAASHLREGGSHYGLVLTDPRICPRGHPRTLGRMVTALDKLLAERPAIDALLNQEHWLA